MRDSVLEQEIREVTSFIELWESFSALVNEARKKGEVEEGAAGKFGEMRKEIAKRYPAIMQKLEVICGEQDDVVAFLGALPSVDTAAMLSDIRWSKTREISGRIDVTLQGILGILQTRKQKLRKVSRSRIYLRRVVSSWFCKLLALTAVILLIFLVLDMIF